MHLDWPAILAQQLNTSMVVRILIASGVVLLLALAGFLVVSRLRRDLRESDAPASEAGFTLSDLRQLYKNGQMSAEEFERAKAKVVESAKRAAERAVARRQSAGPSPRSPGTSDDPTKLL
jgi:hypothetical protein